MVGKDCNSDMQVQFWSMAVLLKKAFLIRMLCQQEIVTKDQAALRLIVDAGLPNAR